MIDIEVGNETFAIQVYRDDAGNFVADAIGPLAERDAGPRPRSVLVALPVARVVAGSEEEAVRCLEQTLATRSRRTARR